MTDEPETTDKTVENSGWNNLKPFKKGYDSRRWLQGRPKKPKDLKAAEELVQHVIWDELSREITSDKGETVDALRLMIRAMIRNKATQKEILERIAGKVQDKLDVTSDGKPLNWKDFINGNAESDNKQS